MIFCTAALLLSGCGNELFGQTDPSNVDVRLFREINNAQTGFKTSLLGVTDDSVWPIVIAVPASLTLVGLLTGRDELFDTGLLTAGSEVLSYSIRQVLKDGLKRQRPYEALLGVKTSHLESADPYSFPSGHTTGAFAVATMLLLRYTDKPDVYIPALVWAGLVGYGRIYFGLHYPSDVLGGALIGAGSAYLIYRWQETLLVAAYELLGKKGPKHVSAFVVPSDGGALIRLTLAL